MAFEGTIQDFPERGRGREELLERARQIGWYHTLRLDGSLTTPGEFDLEPYERYYLPVDDLAGAACLDVGSGSGYWAFALERRGAGAVTALDIPDFADTDFSILAGRDDQRPKTRSAPGSFGEPLRIAATLLGSGVRYRLGSVYQLDPGTFGTFDIVFCGSMLMHLFGPLLALQRMAAVCRDAFLITTETEPSLEGLSAAQYRGHEVPFVHFVPSPTCLANMLAGCGYERVLRGPTFFLEFRDRLANPMRIPHTSFVCLKRANGSRLALPPAAAVEGADTASAVRLVRAPVQGWPGQPFEVTVMVENRSGRFWRGDDPRTRIAVDARWEGRRGFTGRGGSEPAAPPVPIADYLPPGLATLVTLKLQAPFAECDARISLRLVQGGREFRADVDQAPITVTRPLLGRTPGARSDGGPQGRLAREIARMREYGVGPGFASLLRRGFRRFTR